MPDIYLFEKLLLSDPNIELHVCFWGFIFFSFVVKQGKFTKIIPIYSLDIFFFIEFQCLIACIWTAVILVVSLNLTESA